MNVLETNSSRRIVIYSVHLVSRLAYYNISFICSIIVYLHGLASAPQHISIIHKPLTKNYEGG